MAFKFTQTGTELQRIIDSVQTFDSTPTEGSSNPVTSDGIFEAIKPLNDLGLSVANGMINVTFEE